jgi:F-type H+-transporting ATPase subunit epsilon
MVVATTAEGQIGLLPGHEPLLAILAPGDIKVTVEEGSPVIANSQDGGFISMEHDTVTVVVRDGQLVK